MALFTTCPKVLWGFCLLLLIGDSALAQLSDIRHSRQPLPGISEISEIGISVDMGSAQKLVPSSAVLAMLQSRLEDLGYQVTSASTHSPNGLWLHVNCHRLQEKLHVLETKFVMKPNAQIQRISPPCQIGYTYKEAPVPWKHVDRLVYSESVATMNHLAEHSPFLTPKACLMEFFSNYDIPVLMAAEWGHVDRLLHLLKRSKTSVPRQRLILRLLGELQIAIGFPVLVEKLQDIQVAKEAAESLGYFGMKAQPYLLPILQDGSNLVLQVAAAKGLGRIAAATGNSQQTPLYMKMVADTTLDIRIRTELAWALGKAPDMRAYLTLLEIEKYIWNEYSSNPNLQEFRAALDWSIREVKQGGHGDNF